MTVIIAKTQNIFFLA